jgi:uncharacterized membrane protein
VLDTIGGLPAHPLLVHAPLVLIPLVSVSAVAMVASARFSRRFGAAVAVLSALAVVSAAAAKLSGEAWSETVGFPQPHAELADPLPVIVLLQALLVTVLWLLDRGRPTNRARPLPVWLLSALVLVISVVAVYWTIRVGHSGAEAVWGRRA